MTTTCVRNHRGLPSLFLNDRPVSPVTGYIGPKYVSRFAASGIQLYTFTVPGQWWIGPGQYDFAAVEQFITDYTSRAPAIYLMPRMDLSGQGFPWWGASHPAEMNILRDIATGEVRDPLQSDPRAHAYLGHDVRLAGKNLHSFHSTVWRREAGEAVAALVRHFETGPHADRIWGWHWCDGLFQEWFHWSEYAFGTLADYSPAAQGDFRAWLRRTYNNDPHRLSRAWGRQVDFDSASIPAPQARERPAHGEFYDPVRDRPTIDYMQCQSDATVDSIIAISQAAKDAMPHAKINCIFYGYQFSDMPRPQLNAHYSLARLLASPAVDAIASPHAYCNRGEGGYHSPQAVADSIRRAGKLHFDENDCKTVWTPPSVTWKTYISQPTTVAGTIEMLKKDAAYQLASATAQWWMDLTNNGWFDAPQAIDTVRRLASIEDHLQQMDRTSFGQVALVVSQRSMMFQAPREGLHNATLLMFRNWHLSRMGAPFEQLLIDDLARPDLPAYKLYIMANLFHVSADQRQLLDRVVKRNGATVLWVYAPGYLDDESASLENMSALTGIRMGMADVEAELNVALTDSRHPITSGLPASFAYGTGIDREQYTRPPRIEYLPHTLVRPAFYADDPDATVLGLAQSTNRPGLVIKDMISWRSLYTAAPLLSWQLLRNIARDAGVHIYDDQGDMIWANDRFLAINAQSDGPRTIRFPAPVTVVDAYEQEELGANLQSLDLHMHRWSTKLLTLAPSRTP